MAAQKKIRVAIIGLNAPYGDQPPTGVSWAAGAHLPYLRISDKYEVVALQNTTVERARKAIEAYGLANTVKAYGSPEDVASDPDIDLVVSSIRVDRHGGSIIPSIKAGKDVFVEWPLESSAAKAKELVELVKKHEVRNVVGLQGSFSPVLKKLKELLGTIGRVESSTVVAKAIGGSTVSSSLSYYTDKEIGGNLSTIAFGHTIDFVLDVLGEPESYSSLMVIQYPEVDVVDFTGKTIQKGVKNSVPNQIVFNAVLESGAVLTHKVAAHPRDKKAMFGAAGSSFQALDWRIFGSKGEIRVSNNSYWWLNASKENLKVEVWLAETASIVEVDWEDDQFKELPEISRNVARLYEAFASGTEYPDFEHALKRHELIEELYKQNGL